MEIKKRVGEVKEKAIKVNNKKEVKAAKKVGKEMLKNEETYKTFAKLGALGIGGYVAKGFIGNMIKDVNCRRKKITQGSFQEGLVQVGIIGSEVVLGTVVAGATLVLGNKLFDISKNAVNDFADDIEMKYREEVYNLEEEEFNMDLDFGFDDEF